MDLSVNKPSHDLLSQESPFCDKRCTQFHCEVFSSSEARAFHFYAVPKSLRILASARNTSCTMWVVCSYPCIVLQGPRSPFDIAAILREYQTRNETTVLADQQKLWKVGILCWSFLSETKRLRVCVSPCILFNLLCTSG